MITHLGGARGLHLTAVLRGELVRTLLARGSFDEALGQARQLMYTLSGHLGETHPKTLEAVDEV